MKLKKQSLSDRVIALIESARQKVAYTANLAQVYTNYEIGRQIVEEEQGGKRRAGYGEKIIEDLSAKLTARFGRGWSMRNLETIRKFFLVYVREIPQTVSAEFRMVNSANTVCGIRKSEVVSRNSLNTVERIPQTVSEKSATVLWKSDSAITDCQIL